MNYTFGLTDQYPHGPRIEIRCPEPPEVRFQEWNGEVLSPYSEWSDPATVPEPGVSLALICGALLLSFLQRRKSL